MSDRRKVLLDRAGVRVRRTGSALWSVYVEGELWYASLAREDALEVGARCAEQRAQAVYEPSARRPGLVKSRTTYRARHGAMTLDFARRADAERFAARGCTRHADLPHCARCGGRWPVASLAWRERLEEVLAEIGEAAGSSQRPRARAAQKEPAKATRLKRTRGGQR